ncbi:hypothetical protein HZC00_00580 [Candidatus Kaiserbacteria bacterium]|nr:hypothetical protein [Candidatus Kaiserbacteria bacterium]
MSVFLVGSACTRPSPTRPWEFEIYKSEAIIPATSSREAEDEMLRLERKEHPLEDGWVNRSLISQELFEENLLALAQKARPRVTLERLF